MLRDYKTGMSEDVGVFSGKEIEHTPAYGLQTLFLARNDMTFDQIHELAVEVDAEAIYYGANRTFMYNHGTQIAQMMKFLDKGYYVTIDYPYNLHEEVKKRFKLVWNREKFIPFCSIIFFASDLLILDSPPVSIKVFSRNLPSFFNLKSVIFKTLINSDTALVFDEFEKKF